jgi:parvulin-like peptidyl-prolyl isomerase
MSKPLPSPVPSVAARVNGQAIPLRNVALAARQLGGGKVPEDKTAPLLREAMYKLITRELLFQEARARRLGADEKAMEQAYNEARVPYQDDSAWREFLFKQGFDEQTFRAELRIQYTVKSLLDQEAALVPDLATEPEMRDFYGTHPESFESGERLRASHILLRLPEGMPADRKQQLKARAEALLSRVRGGEDFAKLARQYSEDPGSQGKGGELQLFGRGQMDKAFEAAAFALQAGQVSGVVESAFGFHIIKVRQRVPSTRLLFEQVKEGIQAHLARERRERSLAALLARLRTAARIETFL